MLNGTEVCPRSYADEEGKASCRTTLLIDENTLDDEDPSVEILVQAFDPQNAVGSAGIFINLIPNIAPEARILQPSGVYIAAGF